MLGGSAACPNPGDASSSYLIEQDEFKLVLDCGPGSVPVLRRYSRLRDVDAVMISHLHSDHTIDLVPFRYGLRYIPGGGGSRVPLWLPPGGRVFLDRLAHVFAVGPESEDTFFDTEFVASEFDPSMPLQVGPFQVSFTPTRHFIECWAMRFECDGRTLVYLADTNYMETLADFAREADVLICEATMPPPTPDDPKSDGHLTGAEAGRLAQLADVRHLLLSHIWAENGLSLTGAQARSTFDGAITLAESGVRVDV